MIKRKASKSIHLSEIYVCSQSAQELMLLQEKIPNAFDGETAIKQLRVKDLCHHNVLTSDLSLTEEVLPKPILLN